MAPRKILRTRRRTPIITLKKLLHNVKVPYAERAVLYTPEANLKKPQGTYGAEGGGFEPPVP